MDICRERHGSLAVRTVSSPTKGSKPIYAIQYVEQNSPSGSERSQDNALPARQVTPKLIDYHSPYRSRFGYRSPYQSHYSSPYGPKSPAPSMSNHSASPKSVEGMYYTNPFLKCQPQGSAGDVVQTNAVDQGKFLSRGSPVTPGHLGSPQVKGNVRVSKPRTPTNGIHATSKEAPSTPLNVIQATISSHSRGVITTPRNSTPLSTPASTGPTGFQRKRGASIMDVSKTPPLSRSQRAKKRWVSKEDVYNRGNSGVEYGDTKIMFAMNHISRFNYANHHQCVTNGHL